MMRIQRKRAFVIQNRATKIAGAKIGVAKIVEQVCVPLAWANERLVAGDSLLEMSLGVFLVRLCKLCVWLRNRR